MATVACGVMTGTENTILPDFSSQIHRRLHVPRVYHFQCYSFQTLLFSTSKRFQVGMFLVATTPRGDFYIHAALVNHSAALFECLQKKCKSVKGL